MDSLKNFFHKIGIEWTLSVCDNAFVIFSETPANTNGVSWVNNQDDYSYPDSDFCIFANFPQQRASQP
jgi:hypothetical protein